MKKNHHFFLLVIFTIILFYSCSFTKSPSDTYCSIKMNNKTIVFPMKVEYAVKKLGFQYNNEFKTFDNNSIQNSGQFSFTHLKLKENPKSTLLADFFKSEIDFYQYDVYMISGLLRTPLEESKKIIEQDLKITLNNKKSVEIDGTKKEYYLGDYNDCMSFGIYQFPELKFSSTQFIILQKTNEEEIVNLMY